MFGGTGAPRYALEQLGMLMSVQMVETGEVLWDTQQVPTLFTVVRARPIRPCAACRHSLSLHVSKNKC